MTRKRLAAAAAILVGVGLVAWIGASLRGGDGTGGDLVGRRAPVEAPPPTATPLAQARPSDAAVARMADGARGVGTALGRTLTTTMRVGTFADPPARVALAQRSIGLEPGDRVGAAIAPTDPRDEPSRAGTKRPLPIRRVAYREPLPAPPPEIMIEGHRIPTPAARLPIPLEPELELMKKPLDVRALVCFGVDGRPRHVRLVDGSGSPRIDAAVRARLLAEHYRPVEGGDRAAEYCVRVTVVVSS